MGYIGSCSLLLGLLCPLVQGEYILNGTACNTTTFPSDIAATESVVRLSDCPISEVEPGSVDHLQELRVLSMTSMPTLTSFPNLTGLGGTLKKLTLSHNAISYINPVFLNALVVLEKLNIARNDLTYIPNVAALRGLGGLYINDNKFTKVPQLTECVNLNKLDFSNQVHMASVGKDDFIWMGNVVKLELMKYQFVELPDLEYMHSLQRLYLTGSSLELMPAHHTAVLGGLHELSLKDTVQLEFVATLCSKQPHSLIVDVSGSGLKLCDCHHAWFKAAAEAGARVSMQQQVVCGGEDWTSMTTAHFLNHCHQHNTGSDVKVEVTRRASPLFCAFPRQPAYTDSSLLDCLLLCIRTKGCLSVNFRPTVSASVGECVLLAPLADGGYMEAVEEEEEGWMLYGLMFDDMITRHE